MADKFYYKIINDDSKHAVFYVSVEVPVQDEKVCEVLGLDGHHAVSVTKEEFELETVD